jgi:2-keto-4-pentenoate hydratase/2-oxohepta-3-ene-1,7-dioic acid hydratase in catechol pathway
LYNRGNPLIAFLEIKQLVCARIASGAIVRRTLNALITPPNDLTARGAQLATSQWVAGKMLDGFLPLGPFLVTADDIPDPQNLRISCWVNGERKQHSSTAEMNFSVANIIAFVSRHATLKPGDVIATGMPEGVLLGQKARNG